MTLTCIATVKRSSPTSNQATLELKGNFYIGNFDKNNASNKTNKLFVKYRYKNTSDSLFISGYTAAISTEFMYENNSYSGSISLGSNFDYTQSYDFEIVVSDGIAIDKTLTTKTLYVNLPVGTPVFDWGKDDFNVNVDLKINGEHIFYCFYPLGCVYTCGIDFDPPTPPNIPPRGLNNNLEAYWMEFDGDADVKRYFLGLRGKGTGQSGG